MNAILNDWSVPLRALGLAVGAVVLGLVVHYLLFAAAGRFAARTRSAFDDSLVRRGRKPLGLFIPLVALFLVLPALPVAAGLTEGIRHLVVLGLIASVAWLSVALLDVFEDLIYSRYDVSVKDNLAARRVRTQVYVLRRIAVVIIALVTIAVMAMTFPAIRNVGLSLFASAGVAGLVAGMAARSTLTNLLAGVQIALTEPIRLEDVVIVEGEWGWIEEIGTTYVVVRIWDLRRLVVPLAYFIEHPFQNWTRRTADILGTVFLYTDYGVPVEEIRRELHRVLESSGMWDGRVWGLQVTNASEHTMELRALMSAPDSPKAWDLRCHVREKLIGFVQEKYPGSLPRTRAEVRGLPAS